MEELKAMSYDQMIIHSQASQNIGILQEAIQTLQKKQKELQDLVKKK